MKVAQQLELMNVLAFAVLKCYVHLSLGKQALENWHFNCKGE
jgi:hypothetical protein